MNRPEVTRRALLRGSAAAGALAVACHPLPAIAAGDPDAEILELWERRVALLAEAEAIRARPDYDSADWATGELTAGLCSEVCETEVELFATPAAGLNGLLVKLRLLALRAGLDADYLPALDTLDPYDGDDRYLPEQGALSAWADAERLIGGAS